MRLTVIALLLATACGGDDGDEIAVEPTLTSIQTHVFSPSCASFHACHDSDAPSANLDLSDGAAHAALVDRASTLHEGRMLVVPGDPEASLLVAKLRGELGEDEGDRMPLGSDPLHDAAIGAIEAWIAAGAPAD